jgi:hypothetical protein
MSIQSQINRIKQQVNNVYNVLESKNLIPFGTEKKLENLEQVVYDAPIGDTTTPDSSVVEFIERSNPYISNTSLTSLGKYSSYQSNFTDVTFNRVETIGDYCFMESPNLTTANFPKLKNVGTNAFDGCSSLKNVKFDSLETTGNYMFYRSGIDSIDEEKFPVLTKLGAYSFYSEHSQLTNIDHTKILTIGEHSLQNNRYIKTWNLPNVTEVESCGMMGVYSGDQENMLTHYPLPSLEFIGSYGMADMTYTRSIYYPKLSIIGDYAFRSNTNLVSVNLPLLTEMGSNAFDGCSNIETITLPNLSIIKGYAFSNCSSLNTVNLPSLTTVNGTFIFNDSRKLRNVYVPNLTTTQNISGAFRNSYFTNFESDNFEYANSYTFRDCINLLEFYKPRLSYIGQNCFYNCSSLQKIWIPKEAVIYGTTSKSYVPFYRCYHLEIFTDAESQPSEWGTNFDACDSSSNKLTIHYNSTKEDYDNYKVLDANPYSNNYANRLRIVDGVASNFYNTSCVRVRNWDFNRTGNIEMVIKFTTPDTTPTSSQWLYHNEYWSRLGIGTNSDNRMSLTRYKYNDNTYFNICNLELSTTYYLKVYINGGKERFFLSTDGNSYNFVTEDKDSHSYMDQAWFSDYMYFGNNGTSSSEYWRGSIDFNGCYIKYGDQVLWTGVKGASVNTGEDFGWEPPVVEPLDTDGLLAHWNFENNYIDDINNIPFSNSQCGILKADESYRGSYSMIPASPYYDNLNNSTDISKCNLSLDSDFSVSFRVHSDYFGNDNYSDRSYYGLSFRLFSTSTYNSSYDYFASFHIVNGGYSGAYFSGIISTDLNEQRVKDLLNSSWNKFELVYKASENRVSLYVNNTLIDSIRSNYIPTNKLITHLFLYAESSYKQYIDDICIYNKQTHIAPESEVLDTEGLLGYWDFCQNTTTGKTAWQDSVSGKTFPSSNLSILNYGNDNAGCAITYSGQQYLNISSYGLSNTTDFTVEFDSDVAGDSWSEFFRPTDGDLLQSYITLRDSSNTDIFGVGTNKWGMNGGRIYPLVDDFTTPSNAYDRWNKFTLTYSADSQMLKLYINNEKIQETQYTSAFAIHYINLNLGVYGNMYTSYGVIDNLKIYNRVTIQDN